MAYQVRLTGQLDARWADWFEGLTITLDGGDTLIQAGVSDVKSKIGVGGLSTSRSTTTGR